MRGTDGEVEGLEHVTKAGIWVNAGYFTFRKEIFSYMKEGEELVYEPFRRLISLNQIVTYRYDGFFLAMDTFKEKMQIDDMYARGERPWEVWKGANGRLKKDGVSGS
jgi:glucose-1-phosphate cytidylyltransferase